MLRVIHVLDCSLFRVNSAAFLSDGILFVSALNNEIIRLWRANRTL